MKTRRDFLKLGGVASVGFGVTLSLRPLYAAVGKAGGSQDKPAAAYDPLAHQWRMVIDIEK